MSPDSVRFDSVAPRDVALIVLEELSISSSFRTWLLESVDFGIESATLLEAHDSIGDPATDDADRDRHRAAIAVGLESGGERRNLVLTVVAGASALLEDGQARRARALEEQWDDCRHVALAPAETLDGGASDTDAAIDATLSLESLQDRFAARGTDRGEYRAALVNAAIERGARGTSNGTPPAIQQYRSLLTDHDPAFELEVDPDFDLERASDDPTTETTADVTTVAIDAPALAADHRLVHDLESGDVDLRIPGGGHHIEAFAARYAGVIPPTTSLLTAGDALVCRQSVPEIDPADLSLEDVPFDDALEAIDAHLELSEHVQNRRS